MRPRRRNVLRSLLIGLVLSAGATTAAAQNAGSSLTATWGARHFIAKVTGELSCPSRVFCALGVGDATYFSRDPLGAAKFRRTSVSVPKRDPSDWRAPVVCASATLCLYG